MIIEEIGVASDPKNWPRAVSTYLSLASLGRINWWGIGWIKNTLEKTRRDAALLDTRIHPLDGSCAAAVSYVRGWHYIAEQSIHAVSTTNSLLRELNQPIRCIFATTTNYLKEGKIRHKRVEIIGFYFLNFFDINEIRNHKRKRFWTFKNEVFFKL